MENGEGMLEIQDVAAHSGGTVWDNEHKRRNGASAAERHAADAISRLDGSATAGCVPSRPQIRDRAAAEAREPL